MNLVRFKVLVLVLYLLLKFVTVESLQLRNLHPSNNVPETFCLSWGLKPQSREGESRENFSNLSAGAYITTWLERVT
jgi:hypothetical protein